MYTLKYIHSVKRFLSARARVCVCVYVCTYPHNGEMRLSNTEIT